MGFISIAIDGPAGAGKSTVAKELARKLGIWYVDTGAMYRAVAWLVVHFAARTDEESSVLQVLDLHSLHFERSEQGVMRVYADGTEITDQLRSLEVSEVVSKVSVHPSVRARLTEWQRNFSHHESVVMDGRDIGTVVLPDADVKIFLTADLTERTHRRAEEYLLKGMNVPIPELREAMLERDQRDSSRLVAPLKPAADAYCIDSTGKSVAQVVEEILTIVERVAND